jgi:fatty acid desaturase
VWMGFPAHDRHMTTTAVGRQPDMDALRAEIRSEGLTDPAPLHSLFRMLVLVVAPAVIAMTAIRSGGFGWWLAYWAVASVAVSSAMFAVHESVHGLLFRSARANHFAGALFGAVCLVPYASYRLHHLQHHAHTRAPGDSEPLEVVGSRAGYLIAAPLALPVFCGRLWLAYFAELTGRVPQWSPRAQRNSVTALTALLGVVLGAAGLATAVLAGWRLVVALWLIPSCTALVLGSFTAIAEHYGAGFAPAPVFETTRTIESNRFVRTVVWNGNYHAAHHLVASVPGRNLPRLQEMVDPWCRSRSRSYLDFHRSLWRDMGRGEFPAGLPPAVRE